MQDLGWVLLVCIACSRPALLQICHIGSIIQLQRLRIVLEIVGGWGIGEADSWLIGR